MNLSTQGTRYHCEHKVPVLYIPEELFTEAINASDRYKIVVIHSGSGILRLSDSSCPFLAPTLCCFRETDRVELEQAVKLQAETLYFHPQYINSTLSFAHINTYDPQTVLAADRMDYDSLRPFLRKRQQGIYSLGPVTEHRIRILMAAIREQLEQEPDSFWPCRARSYLIELLFAILHLYLESSDDSEGLLGPTSGSESHPVILYLLNNYSKKIQLDQLAREFGTNRSSLNQEFKQATGFSVIDYLIRLRIRIAGQLLKDTSLPITEIAEKIGYTDVTHFGRIFRKHTGQNPSSYRTQ